MSLPAAEHINYTLRQPIGPVAIITPWNTPFMLSTWKIAPALAAGCTVVHKPAEWSPLTAMLLAEIMTEAGVPAGVVNLVNGSGEHTGRLLTEHAAIKATAFIGESKTGSLIMSQGAPTLKRVHLELGGKNPVIVLDDASLERAFIKLLPEEVRRGHKEPVIEPWKSSGGTPAIEAEVLTQRFGAFTAVALHTAVGFLALGAGILTVHSDRGLMAIVTSDGNGGMVARRLLPRRSRQRRHTRLCTVACDDAKTIAAVN